MPYPLNGVAVGYIGGLVSVWMSGRGLLSVGVPNRTTSVSLVVRRLVKLYLHVPVLAA